MKRLPIVKETKIFRLVTSGVLLLSGLFVLIFFEPGMLALRWIVGADCILLGGAKLLGYFTNDLYRLAFQYDFAVGSVCAAIGVLALSGVETVISPMSLLLIVAIYVALDGCMKVQIAWDAKQFGMTYWLALLIPAVVIAVAGIAVAVTGCYAEDVPTVPIGACLIADAVVNFWVTMYTVRVRARKKGKTDDYDVK